MVKRVLRKSRWGTKRVSELTSEDVRRALEIFSKRPKRSQTIDKRYAGKVPAFFETWVRHPERYDLPGVDLGSVKRASSKNKKKQGAPGYVIVSDTAEGREEFAVADVRKGLKVFTLPLSKGRVAVAVFGNTYQLRNVLKEIGMKFSEDIVKSIGKELSNLSGMREDHAIITVANQFFRTYIKMLKDSGFLDTVRTGAEPMRGFWNAVDKIEVAGIVTLPAGLSLAEIIERAEDIYNKLVKAFEKHNIKLNDIDLKTLYHFVVVDALFSAIIKLSHRASYAGATHEPDLKKYLKYRYLEKMIPIGHVFVRPCTFVVERTKIRKRTREELIKESKAALTRLEFADNPNREYLLLKYDRYPCDELPYITAKGWYMILDKKDYGEFMDKLMNMLKQAKQ